MAVSDLNPAADDPFAFCEAQVKGQDRAAWLATLFAPAERRPALYALLAFAFEAESVRAKVKEPLAGELRLQWWTDAIEGETRGGVRGHPIAAALLDTIPRSHVSRPALTGFLDVKRGDLYNEPIATVGDFDVRADQTEGALIAAQVQILAGKVSAVALDAARHAGRAIAALKSVQALGADPSPLRVTIPLDLLREAGTGLAEVQVRRPTAEIAAAVSRLTRHGLDEVRALRALRQQLEPEAGPAFLMSSLAEPMFRRLQRRPNPFEPVPDLPQWRKQWLLWRASRRTGVL